MYEWCVTPTSPAPQVMASGSFIGRARWMLGVFPLIDLAALAAYPADFFSDAELQVGKVLRSTRVVRVIMLLRIDRNAQAMTAGVTGPIPIFFQSRRYLYTSFKSKAAVAHLLLYGDFSPLTTTVVFLHEPRDHV